MVNYLLKYQNSYSGQPNLRAETGVCSVTKSKEIKKEEKKGGGEIKKERKERTVLTLKFMQAH